MSKSTKSKSTKTEKIVPLADAKTKREFNALLALYKQTEDEGEIVDQLIAAAKKNSGHNLGLASKSLTAMLPYARTHKSVIDYIIDGGSITTDTKITEKVQDQIVSEIRNIAMDPERLPLRERLLQKARKEKLDFIDLLRGKLAAQHKEVGEGLLSIMANKSLDSFTRECAAEGLKKAAAANPKVAEKMLKITMKGMGKALSYGDRNYFERTYKFVECLPNMPKTNDPAGSKLRQRMIDFHKKDSTWELAYSLNLEHYQVRMDIARAISERLIE